MKRLKRTFVVGSVLFTLLFLIVHFTPVIRWYARWLAGDWTDSDGDILIVLSSEMQADNMIGPTSYWRSVYAVRAWREGHFRAVVVSGGHAPGASGTLAAVIGDFLACNGIPRDKIFLEDRSISTRENALFTKELIAGWPGKKVLLTSECHMFRARRTFEAAGLPVVPRPIPDILKQSNSVATRGLCFWTLGLETVKIAYYWEKGWIHLP